MAYILSQIIKKKVPEWNEKVFGEADFYALCEKEKIRVMESEQFKHRGEYSIHKQICFILINTQLKIGEKVWVCFHELGHHFLHHPIPHHFSKGTWRRMDREANFFASISLIPSYLVKEKTLGEIAEEFNYPKDLILIRKEIYEAYKI